jgi:hypothetical protein
VNTGWANQVAGVTPQNQKIQTPTVMDNTSTDTVSDGNLGQPIDFSDIETGLPGFEIKILGKQRAIINEDTIGYSSVVAPASQRSSSKQDAPSSKLYTIYTFNIYNYTTLAEFSKAVSSSTLTEPIGQIDLTFDQLLNEGYGNILESAEQKKEVRFLTEHKERIRRVKYCLQLADLGGASEIMKGVNNEWVAVYFFTGGGAKHNPRIKIHPGGPQKSAQCATTPLLNFFQKRSNTQKIEDKEEKGNKKTIPYFEATEKLLSFEEYFRIMLRLDDNHTKALIILPGKHNNYPK